MSFQRYAIIDPANKILGIVLGLTAPEPAEPYLNCTFIECDATVGLAQDGWTYVDGQFVAPPPSLPPVVPMPTLSDLQAQMAQIQAHMSTLLAQSSS